jgi:hypothetical protein
VRGVRGVREIFRRRGRGVRKRENGGREKGNNEPHYKVLSQQWNG